uniref:Aph-1 n=1 Tax=Pristionchus pacificus TaxID=54126 RepID=A0A8R1Z666_PRIPA
MGYLLTVGCYLVAFAPTTTLFLRLVASDPLKVILFGCGSFVWLVSLLLTSIVWTALIPLQDYLWVSLIVSIVLQESARVVCFFVLRSAQKGLASMANPTSAQHVRITGVMSLANSRHLLAVVIGLGMGAVAALFLTMNAFDAISGSGVVGGLKQTLDGVHLRSSFPRLLPLHWSINAMLLSMLHIVWTVLVWDSCHHYAIRRDAAAAAASTTGQSSSGGATASTPLLQNEHQQWWMPALIAVAFHFASTVVSYLSSSNWGFVAISLKLIILISLTFYCYSIVRHDSPFSLLKEIALALRDWITLAALRDMCSKKEQENASNAEMNRGTDEVVIRDGSNSVRQRRISTERT